MSDTRKRREAILELIASKRVSTQNELADALKKQGFDTTQATISRDIKSLMLIKTQGQYALPGPELRSEPLPKRLKEKIMAINKAGDSMLVIHTPVGEAGAVGIALDNARFPFVVGTVAGDDTVFVACDGPAKTQQAIKTLRNLIK